MDGFQHYEEDGILKDAKRDAYLKGLGIHVLRYTNIDINKRFDEICVDILKNIDLLDYIIDI